jgi:hypothetical protein
MSAIRQTKPKLPYKFWNERALAMSPERSTLARHLNW